MKALHLAVAAVAAVSLAACATPTPASYHTQAEKVMLGAEGAFNAAAKAQLAVCGRPLPLVARSPKCLKGDDLRHQGYAALKVARTAYNGGSVPDTAALLALAAQITTLFPKEP